MRAPLQSSNDADAAKAARTATPAQRFLDNRPAATPQHNLAEMANTSPRVSQQRALSDAIHTGARMTAQVAQRIASTGQRHMGSRMASNGVVQKLADEDVTSKADKTELKKLAKKYSDSLGFGKPLYQYAEETFDYLFGAASDLKDLDTRITSQIAKAQAKHDAATAAPATASATAAAPSVMGGGGGGGAAPSSPVTATSSAPSGGGALPSLSTASPSLGSASAGGAAGPAPKKAAKKPAAIPFSELGFNFGAPMVQQPAVVVKQATNPLILGWIAARPAGSSVAYTGTYVSSDTVYIYVRVTLPAAGLEIPVYDLEIHYHPVPTSANYLHVKAKAGGSAGNIIAPGSWLIPAGRLDGADTDWDAVNPTKLSTKPRT